MPDPVILELAVNGATPRGRNRHVPRNPGEIAEVALAGVERLGRQPATIRDARRILGIGQPVS